MTRDDPTPQPGDMVVEKYRVKQVLGAGGMGVVVSAEHVQLGQTVALKFLRTDAFTSQTIVERFLREARAAAQLKSEHVVRVTDVGTLPTGAPYMVMEHLSGTDLGDEIVRRGQLPVKEAIGYVLQACEAIAEAHAAGILHRDLKPSNLFLTRYPDGSPLVKVLDFGISKTLSKKTDLEPSLTGTAELMGSPRYMSPEQIRAAKELDARSDVWSLGIILYELLAGRTPFDGESLPEVLAQIAADPPTPLGEVRADLPAGLEDVIMRCLEKNRETRYASVDDFAIALLPHASSAGRGSIDRIRAIAGLPASPVAHEPAAEPTGAGAAATAAGVRTATGWGGTHAEPARNRSWPVVASVGVAAVVLAAAGVFMAIRSVGVGTGAPSEVVASVVVQPTIAPPAAVTSAPPVEIAPPAAPPPEPSASAVAVKPRAVSTPRRVTQAPAPKSSARPAVSAKPPGFSKLLDGRE
jgi:eukaryotic-like serine/threonine-protein kinase